MNKCCGLMIDMPQQNNVNIPKLSVGEMSISLPKLPNTPFQHLELSSLLEYIIKTQRLLFTMILSINNSNNTI